MLMYPKSEYNGNNFYMKPSDNRCTYKPYIGFRYLKMTSGAINICKHLNNMGVYKIIRRKAHFLP